jgi:tRNA(Leu) C34 or U34 (ribose-2'-O)-methylase TrmL
MALTSPLLKERQIKRGDEVITVAAAFPTTVSPLIQYGAIPVFVDITLDTLNIKIEDLEKAISKKTKAIMIAHTLGNPFNIGKIKDFCDKHNLWLIEDNCDALGSKYKNKFTGTFGDIGTSSFYPPHHMTMGEGGAVYTDNPLLKKMSMIIPGTYHHTLIVGNLAESAAEAIGASCVISSKGSVDAYNPKVLRSTMGAIYNIPVFNQVALDEYLKVVGEKSFLILAARIDGSAYHYDINLNQPVCFLIGNEGHGLRDEISDLANSYVKLPMVGQSESLNASVASSILIYEAYRQRH